MATAGEAELKTNYPIEKGLTARTQTQTGRQMSLIAQEGSTVSKKDKVLL